MNRKDFLRETKPLRPPPLSSTTTFSTKDNFLPTEYERQALMMKEQDEDLEELRISVERLGDMGKSINEELVGQEVLIGEVERDIDTTTTRLDFVQKKMELMIVKAGSNGQMFMIVFLIILFVILIVLVFT
ncbi:hypothetical protein M758_1G331600 [Ceratodon purpureus]|uniref:t-SNARE coiled-coil homology domain-containing protein n=1 Tax=Ceratodon purpureus TaxID=3225 RepID=A0A8T0JF08_CERPU|nr:hypothetical protein KC19_1G339100 [Ceratodon purpureus]KAG0632482.1 hypothetical protein M758_1G331600 [Ceratodon purpureus]